MTEANGNGHEYDRADPPPLSPVRRIDLNDKKDESDAGGLFSGLHMANSSGSSERSNSFTMDKTPRLSNSSTGKIVDPTVESAIKGGQIPAAPSLRHEDLAQERSSSTGRPNTQQPLCNDEDSALPGNGTSEQQHRHDVLEGHVVEDNVDETKSKVQESVDTSVSNVIVEVTSGAASLEEDISPAEVTGKAFAISAEDQQALDDAFDLHASSSHHASPLQLKQQQEQKQPTSPVGNGDRKRVSSPDVASPPPPPGSKSVTPTSTLNRKSSNRRGLGKIHTETPIPHADICLAFLRRFAYKTEARIPVTYGGTKATSVWQYVMSPIVSPSVSVKEMENFFGPYGELMELIFDEEHDRLKASRDNSGSNFDDDLNENNNASNIGLDSDIPEEIKERASLSIALFVHLFSVWGHASSAFLERKDKKSLQTFTELQAAIFDAASNLVAYGCLDGVMIGLMSDLNGIDEYQRASHMLAQSVFNSDLSVERNELAAIKFLLGTSCRTVTSGPDDSLIRGSFLLQSIRTLYHVYLTTESEANKITARAALQQLVTSVFAKAVRTPIPSEASHEKDFPTENHRDAFLVLRSICKLSMRNLPDLSRADAEGSGAMAMHSHVGIQTSASNETWDGERLRSGSDAHNAVTMMMAGTGGSDRGSSATGQHDSAQLILTSAIHPALESKLLALELILYILQHVDFSANGFIQHCGPQFHGAIRNYLCVSLLKNCTADSTKVVSLSLRIFVPTVRHFRIVLKAEIEAFVTNVFFVILDSKNSPAEHKRLVVNTFHEICSDPSTLAEIFLNYDCDLSAVDLFHRIVNTLSKLSRFGYNLQDDANKGSFGSVGGISSLLLNSGGPSEAQMEKLRNEGRALRLDSMRALRQILASLHASIVEPMQQRSRSHSQSNLKPDPNDNLAIMSDSSFDSNGGKQSLVEIYGSKKKRRAEESEAILRFNQKPSAGIAYLAKCGHLDDKDPNDVARYLLKRKDELDKTQIGEYLGREPEYQGGFSIAVLHEYVRLLDLSNLVFDDAIRFFLSGFRLPGEAQKVSICSFSVALNPVRLI